MKPEQLLRMAAFMPLLLSALLLPAAGQRKKVSLALLGGMNLFAASGSDSDYIAGENDFPRSPAYIAPAMGVRGAFLVSLRWAWTIDARYGVAAAIDLRDPSDQETVRVDAPGYLTAVVGGQYFLGLFPALDLYAAIGAGIEYRQVEEKEFISDLGSKIVIAPLAKPLSPLLAAGIGLQYEFADALAMGVECRAMYTLREPALWVVTPALFLALKF
ncbi:MAG TPA: hypothetical protein VF451_02850 [Acidobacteriota bacterium]